MVYVIVCLSVDSDGVKENKRPNINDKMNDKQFGKRLQMERRGTI